MTINQPKFEVGQKVHFRIFKGCRREKCENGIIKAFPPKEPHLIEVVYEANCKGDWENCLNYSGQMTQVVMLESGWI